MGYEGGSFSVALPASVHVLSNDSMILFIIHSMALVIIHSDDLSPDPRTIATKQNDENSMEAAKAAATIHMHTWKNTVTLQLSS